MTNLSSALFKGEPAASSGQLELNAFMPLISESLLESLELLNNGVTIFREKCIEGITPIKKDAEKILKSQRYLRQL